MYPKYFVNAIAIQFRVHAIRTNLLIKKLIKSKFLKNMMMNDFQKFLK